MSTDRMAHLMAIATLLACSTLPAQENTAATSGSIQADSSSDSRGGAASSTEALQKATQNPVANLINRVILPVVWQPYTGSNPANASLGTFGLGDLNPTVFLSPAHPGKIIWGVGPAFVFPTATDPTLGQGKWSIGPSFVVLAQPGHWSLGALVNNVWSFAGQSDRRTVNQFLMQYFVNYNLSGGWYVTSAPIVTANWAAPQAKNVWTVPFGIGMGRIQKLGFQPINWQ